VFAESPNTGPSRNTLERGGSKGDRLKVAISLRKLVRVVIRWKEAGVKVTVLR